MRRLNLQAVEIALDEMTCNRKFLSKETQISQERKILDDHCFRNIWMSANFYHGNRVKNQPISGPAIFSHVWKLCLEKLVKEI